MKKYNKKNKKLYYYIPINSNSKGVKKAKEKFGDGRYELPSSDPEFCHFIEYIEKKGGKVKPISITINEKEAFLELQTNKRDHVKTFNVLIDFLTPSARTRIEVLKKKKDVKIFTKSQKETG
jgi:hypothetical protein